MKPTTNPTVRICSFGEILWDMIDGHAHMGGAPFNFAAHSVRLGSEAHLVSRVGNDRLGVEALAIARGIGIHTERIGVDPHHPTGVVNVAVSPYGQPQYSIGFPAAWDYIEFSPALIPELLPKSFDAIYFGTLAQRNEVSRNSLHAVLSAYPGTPVIYDINLRQTYYTKDIIEWGLRHATFVKLNEDECRFLSELLLQKPVADVHDAEGLRQKYEIDTVLVTLGANGCCIFDEHDVTHIPGHEVCVVDTIGAGDAFAAAFLAAWLRGASHADAARLANTVGAHVATQSGAIPEYSDEIKRLIDWHPHWKHTSDAAHARGNNTHRNQQLGSQALELS